MWQYSQSNEQKYRLHTLWSLVSICWHEVVCAYMCTKCIWYAHICWQPSLIEGGVLMCWYAAIAWALSVHGVMCSYFKRSGWEFHFNHFQIVRRCKWWRRKKRPCERKISGFSAGCWGRRSAANSWLVSCQNPSQALRWMTKGKRDTWHSVCHHRVYSFHQDTSMRWRAVATFMLRALLLSPRPLQDAPFLQHHVCCQPCAIAAQTYLGLQCNILGMRAKINAWLVQ